MTGDSTNNCQPRRPLKFIPYVTNLVVHIILKILGCIYLVLPWLGRFFAVQRAENHLGNNSTYQKKEENRLGNNSKPQNNRKPQLVELRPQEQHISRSIKEDPLWNRLQQLETTVNDLVSKPTKIPQEKDDMLRESLSRIKSIEYDLQKTKKVNYPSLPNMNCSEKYSSCSTKFLVFNVLVIFICRHYLQLHQSKWSLLTHWKI